MGSPLSPILADIFMEEFEASAPRSADLQPSLCLRYVDDTFVVWPHGRDSLQDLNEQHSSIKFTMEVEEDGNIPSLMLASPKILTAPYTTFTGNPPTQTITSTNALSITPASSHRSTAPLHNAPTPYVTQTVYPRNYGISRLPSSVMATNPEKSKHRSLSQTSTR